MTDQTGLRSEIRMARRNTVEVSRRNVERPVCSSRNTGASVVVMLRLRRGRCSRGSFAVAQRASGEGEEDVVEGRTAQLDAVDLDAVGVQRAQQAGELGAALGHAHLDHRAVHDGRRGAGQLRRDGGDAHDVRRHGRGEHDRVTADPLLQLLGAALRPRSAPLSITRIRSHRASASSR